MSDSPTPESSMPVGSGDERTPALLKKIQSGRLDPKSIATASRRQLVVAMMNDGYSTAEIAEILKLSDRTIERDRKAIREANAVSRDPRLVEQMTGRLIGEGELCVQRIRKAARDEDASPSREEIERGQVLAAPGSITPHTKFEAEVYVLSKEEGGRHTPFFKGYRPQFYFRTTDVTGAVELPDGVEMVMPGDNIKVKVELIAPIAMEDGLRFAIREGGRTVGAGVVSKIFE